MNTPPLSILVVDPSPTTYTAFRWACPTCSVIACASLQDAHGWLHIPRLMVVIDLMTEGIDAFWRDAAPPLRERLLFVCENPCPPALHHFAEQANVPLLYKPLSLPILAAALDAFRSL